MFLSLVVSFALASAQTSHLVVLRSPTTNPCVDYIGRYGTEGDAYCLHRFVPDCISPDLSSENATFIHFLEDRKLFYVQEAGLDPAVRKENDLASLSPVETILASEFQARLMTTPTIDVVYRTNTSALISTPPDIAKQIDIYLPRFVVPILIDTTSTYVPVPDSARRRVLEWLKNITYRPQIDKLVNSLSVDYLRLHLEYLTGESSELLTRYATSNDARKAARYIKAVFEENGAVCELHEFLSGYSPNVICRYAAASPKPEGTIILGAHYDSRAVSMIPDIRAPGANDDGSGIVSLLGISRVIKDHNITFSNNIELVAFCAEEQGLIGSSHYARRLKKEDVKVLLMIQADMIGYRKTGEDLQIAFPAFFATTEASLYLTNLTQLYSKDLSYGYTNACCSDHQSFYNQGIASTHVFERIGGIADPMYHNEGDLSHRDGYDFEQIRSISRVTFSAILDTSLSSSDIDL